MVEDLYAQWLSIPAGTRPPDYYALLKLPRFEADMGAIERATRSQLARLDKYSIHPDPAKRDACHRIMNEVARARIVLTSPERKKRYDIDLRAHAGCAGRAAGGSELGVAKVAGKPEQWAKSIAAAARRSIAAIAGWEIQVWIYAGIVAAVIAGVALIGFRVMSATLPGAQPIV